MRGGRIRVSPCHPQFNSPWCSLRTSFKNSEILRASIGRVLGSILWFFLYQLKILTRQLDSRVPIGPQCNVRIRFFSFIPYSISGSVEVHIKINL